MSEERKYLNRTIFCVGDKKKKKSFFIQYQIGLSLVQEKMQWTSLKQDSKMEGVGACLLAPQAFVLLKAD